MTMQRLAWFSPMPPDSSAIAGYTADLLPVMARSREVDLFTAAAEAPRPDGAAAVFSASEFERRQRAAPYDLIVYQLGAAACHNDMWPHLVRYPGLVVLHDAYLHQARVRMLLADESADDYRAEFAYNHPHAPAAVAELGVARLLGSLSRLWPMRQIVLDSARALLVHNAWLAAQLRQEAPRTEVHVLDMGVPDVAVAADGREAVRQRHHVPRDATVFAAFGAITPAQRISPLLRALAAPADGAPPWHLLLCGEPADRERLQVEAQALDIDRHVSVTGRIPPGDLPAHLAAADVGVCLCWPPTRAISASWLRCLAAGKPTIVTDLVHTSDVPALDPRDWMVAGRPPAHDLQGHSNDPVGVTIDIRDEDHSLTLAVARLAGDHALRAELGGAARRYWKTRFTLDRMAAGYDRIIERACRATFDEARRARLPAHLSGPVNN